MSFLFRHLGVVDYTACWQAMRDFTAARVADTPDELWAVEHPPVFTLGRAGKREHVLAPGAIPVVHSDRGGQVTYHGPGQLVLYVLLDVNRRGIGPRELVRRLEQGMIDYLESVGVSAGRRAGAPGVYIGDAKIGALGLRLRKGCSYHGLAFNVAMDLAPFQRINPCGYAGLRVTQLADAGGPADLRTVLDGFIPCIARNLSGDAAGEFEFVPRHRENAPAPAP